MLQDQFNRIHNYLRLSITDRCNLRCRYCMPEDGIDFSKREDILRYEEMLRLVSIFKDLGVDKLRLTGGEPFARRDFMLFLEKVTKIIPNAYITTNASLLSGKVEQLREIGIKGLNISLDTLDQNLFFTITHRDEFQRVMNNINQCIESNLPIKINMVVMRGVNDHEYPDFIEFGKKHKVPIRFIEVMPFNDYDGNENLFVDYLEIEKSIRQSYSNLERIPSNKPSSSIHYKIDDYQFGIIPAYSRSLCGICNRIRLTPKGDLMTCLYASSGISLRDMIRKGDSSEDIQKAIQNAFFHKAKDGNEAASTDSNILQSMTTIGG